MRTLLLFCRRFAVRSAGIRVDTISIQRGPQGRGDRRGESGKENR